MIPQSRQIIVSHAELERRRSWSLDRKIEESWDRIFEWYVRNRGKVYVSTSGGLDSTVLLDLVRTCPELVGCQIPAVFFDTGLEFPENRSFMKATPGVQIFRPKMNFKTVIEKYGYPVISKRIAQSIHEVRNTKGDSAIKRLRLTGIKPNGEFDGISKIPDKWLFLCDAPFKISDRCCVKLKKTPALLAEKSFGFPMLGMRAGEGNKRSLTYQQFGCNAFDVKRPRSWPMAFWTHQDVLDYIKARNLPYSEIYDMGYRRTGCVFCMFGVHLEKEPNRFQRLHETHPRLWNYCIDQLGIGRVLEYIGVPYHKPVQMDFWPEGGRV